MNIHVNQNTKYKHNIKPKLKAIINRGHCLWCSDNNKENIFNCSGEKCKCIQYNPIGKYGSVCKCGHGEIWHHRNSNFNDKLITKNNCQLTVSPYINSLKHIINDYKLREKALLARIRQISQDNIDSYQCSICLRERRNTVFLPCKHAQFCKDCSSKWLETKKNCPICRKKVECVLDILI